MKKRQRIRVLKTDELGTITDKILMNRKGAVKAYCQVRLDKRPGLDRWYWSNELGSVKETCRATFSGDDNTEIYVDVTYDYEKQHWEIKLTGKPSNLNEHPNQGMPLILLAYLLKGIYTDSDSTKSVKG